MRNSPFLSVRIKSIILKENDNKWLLLLAFSQIQTELIMTLRSLWKSVLNYLEKLCRYYLNEEIKAVQ